MVFDNRDFGVLRLCGVCRYLPTEIGRYFNSPYFSPRELHNLRKHKLIKAQTNLLSYTLTYEGREALRKFGYEFPQDLRLDIKSETYFRKLKSAYFIATMFLAGIDVFHSSVESLAGKKTGFVSSLILRSTKAGKVLAGARLLGILKIGSTAFVPYHIDNSEEWIVPCFERDSFNSQVAGIKDTKTISLILSGKSLEELWRSIHPRSKSVTVKNGLKRFGVALEELGYDYLLVPENDFGVIQLRILKLAGYKERLARAIGLDTKYKGDFPECDGLLNNIPHIIALDFNVKRVVRILNQIQRKNPSIEPKIYCLYFQKETMFALLRRYTNFKSVVVAIDEDNLQKVFPEIMSEDNPYEIPNGKEGVPVDANERNIKKDDIEASKGRKVLP